MTLSKEDLKSKVKLIKENNNAYGYCVFTDLVSGGGGLGCKTCIKHETGVCSPHSSRIMRGLE